MLHSGRWPSRSRKYHFEAAEIEIVVVFGAGQFQQSARAGRIAGVPFAQGQVDRAGVGLPCGKITRGDGLAAEHPLVVGGRGLFASALRLLPGDDGRKTRRSNQRRMSAVTSPARAGRRLHQRTVRVAVPTGRAVIGRESSHALRSSASAWALG